MCGRFLVSRLNSTAMEGSFVSSGRYLFTRLLVSVLLWSLYISLYAKVSAQESQITCNAPAVKLNESTSLRCSFPEDVGTTRRDFTVYRYIEKGNPDAVLDCWWLSGKVDCFVAQGYHFDKQISSRTVRLDIPRVSAPQIAMYACQLASYGPDSIKTCELNLKLDGNSICEIPSVKVNSKTDLTCYFPEDLSKTRTDFTVHHYSRLGVQSTVVDCKWEGESANCNTAPGYVFNMKVTSHLLTSHLKIGINNALENHEGTYTCLAKGAASSVNCSFILEKEKTSTCHDLSVKENEPTTFTCNFSVNVNVTRKNIKVTRQSITGNDVVNCTWVSEELSCTTAPGFEFHNTVTDRLQINVPRATLDHNGTYVCHLQGSQSENFESCDFIVMTASTSNGSSIAVTVAVVIVMLIPATLIMVFIIMKFGFCTRLEQKVLDEETPMIESTDKSITQDVVVTTKNFLADLSNGFRKTYPEYETKAYVVPSLYFNNNTYEVKTFAGEDVYITSPPDEHIVKYDMAMSRVLTSLHHLAKHTNEVMFVISQFDYDKYLANPRKEFAEHNLPRPGQLRKSHKRYGDFDILIVHRHHGLVVGVVKTCSGGTTQGVDETHETVVEELKKGCTQLDEAENMLQHLMSDPISNQNQQMHVQKLLILPNLSEKRLGTVINENENMAQILSKCLGFPKTAGGYNEFLCGDHMRGSKRTQKIKDWFNSRFSESRDKAFASDDEYAAIVARFCGPATMWSLNFPDHQSGMLPKTLEDSVWLTGELLTKPLLLPKQWEILNENSSVVFLSGPPASGKTRMLVLAGKKWMYEGHKVHVVSTGRKSWAANHMIYTELCTASKENGISGSCELITFEKENMKEMINKLSKLAKKDPVYIVADEAYKSEKSSFKDLVGGLLKQVPELHLWAASCLPNIAPQSCQVHVFTDSFTCPPAILLHAEVTQLASENSVAKWKYDSRTAAPTDGPPVMIVNHDAEGHNGDYPHDCKKCVNEVLTFLQTLGVIKPVGAKQKAEGQPRLSSKDILVLCEKEEKTALSAALKKSGVSIEIVDERNSEQVFKANNNALWVAKVKHLFGIKRKVVVFLEGNPKPKKSHKMSVDLKRLRGLTSSTSQLIWLKGR